MWEPAPSVHLCTANCFESDGEATGVTCKAKQTRSFGNLQQNGGKGEVSGCCVDIQSPALSLTEMLRQDLNGDALMNVSKPQ